MAAASSPVFNRPCLNQADYREPYPDMPSNFLGRRVSCIPASTRNGYPVMIIVNPGERVSLAEWAQKKQRQIAGLFEKYGALHFRGFGVPKTTEGVAAAFKAVAQMSTVPYEGNAPRGVIDAQEYVYKSTALTYAMTGHQEVSVNRAKMPEVLAFFCVTPPAVGTGRMMIASAKEVTYALAEKNPTFFEKLCTKEVVYEATHWPEDQKKQGNWFNRSRIELIKQLNPSHVSIERRCGGATQEDVDRVCAQEGLTASWNKEWLTLYSPPTPATINCKGVTVVCNQLNTILNPEVCGGWGNYVGASMALYPTRGWMQINATFSDGEKIRLKDVSGFASVINACTDGVENCEEGDVAFYDNERWLHGKTEHKGVREIWALMGGSALHPTITAGRGGAAAVAAEGKEE